MPEKGLTIEQRLAAVLTQPEPVQQGVAAPQVAQERAPEVVQPEAAAEPVAAPQAAQETEPAAAEEEAATWFPERLEDIAEAGGWDVADLYKVRLKVTGPDGKPAEVTLGEWKDSYQQSAQLDAIRRAERESHERAEAARKQTLDALQQRSVEIQGLVTAAEQRLLARFNAVDWDRLRTTDPAEWTARRTELGEEYQALQGIKQQAMQAAQQQYQQESAKQAEQWQQYLREQENRVRAMIPEFQDPEKASAAKAATVDWMRKSGWSDIEIGMVSHSANLVKLVRDHMKLASADTSAKKVQASPKKFLRPGVSPQRKSAEAEAYQAARARLRKSGSMKDTVDVFKRILGG